MLGLQDIPFTPDRRYFVKYKLSLLSLLVLLGTSAGLGESFRNPFRIPTASDPEGVMVADVNGDGRMDVLWTTRGELIEELSTVQVFLAQADGSFVAGPVTTLPTGVGPYCRAVDETGDGKADLICTYSVQATASMMVFPSNGDGTFGDPIETPLPASLYASYWDPIIGQPADFNKDKVADFAVASADSGETYVMLGNGDGTFSEVKQTASSKQSGGSLGYGSGFGYQALDVNGDGHLDLLFTNGAVYLGDGTGQFKPTPSPVEVGGFCVFGKIDGEPHIDEVCGQDVVVDGDIAGGTQLLIFHGNGDGSFNATPIKTVNYGDRTNESNGEGTFESPIAVVDLNGDGIPDVLAEAADGLTVLLGKPAIGFAYPVHYATGYNPIDSGFVGEFLMQIADLNGDGLPDLIQAGPNGVYVTYGRPDGVLDTAPAFEVAEIVDYVTVADFNGDGIPDIAVTGDHAIELTLGKGDGTFEYRVPLPRGDADFSSADYNYDYIAHGDFNGDHHQDILAGNYILFGHGNGTFTTPAAISNNLQSFPTSPFPLVFDFNGDGKDDLFNYDPGHFYVALSNGDGSFKTVTSAISTAASLQTQPAIGDVNGDGKLDAVFGGLESVEIFWGRGSGSISYSALKLPIPKFGGMAVEGSVAVAIGDFDGDGHKDIALLATPSYSLWASAGQAVLFVFYGNGAGVFTAGVPVATFNRAYSALFAADVNKDGKDDIVLQFNGDLDIGSAVAVVHGAAGRTFGPEADYYPGSDITSLAIADLNRDGFPDMVFRNSGVNFPGNSVTVLMNLGNTKGVTGSVYAIAEPSDTASSFELAASLVPPDQTTLAGNVSFYIDGALAGSAALAGNQASIKVSKSYPAGLHTIKATRAGDADFAAVSLTGKHQVTAGYPTSTSIFSNYSYDGAAFMTPVTFSITVQSTSGTPVGSVALLNGSTRLATLKLTGGAAIYTTASLLPGTRNITAEFLPGPAWASSSASLQQTIDPINPTVSLTLSPKRIYAFEPVVLSVTVKGPGPLPTGTIQFQNNSSPVGTIKLVDGKATFTTSFSSTGYQSVSAQYSGNQDYKTGYASSPTLNVMVNPTVTLLHAVPNPAAAGQPVTITARIASSTGGHNVPTGSVVLTDNGGQVGFVQLVKGAASLTLSSLAVGKHPIVASYSGDSGFNSSRSNPMSLVIDPAKSSIVLSASPNPAAVGAAVTFKAVVKGPRQPSGSVVFREGSNALSAAIEVDSEGTATFTTKSLAAGTHNIVAAYSGDPNLDASASAPLDETINQ